MCAARRCAALLPRQDGRRLPDAPDGARQAEGADGCAAVALELHMKCPTVAVMTSFFREHEDNAAGRAAGLAQLPDPASRVQRGHTAFKEALRTGQRAAGSPRSAGPSTLPFTDHRWRSAFRLEMAQQLVVHAVDCHVSPLRFLVPIRSGTPIVLSASWCAPRFVNARPRRGS